MILYISILHTYIHTCKLLSLICRQREKKCLFPTAPSQTAFSLCDTLCLLRLITIQWREKTQGWPQKQSHQFSIIKGEATKVHSQVNRVGQKHYTEAELACSDMQWIEVSANSGGILVQRWKMGEVGKETKENKPVVTKAVYPCNFLRFQINSSRH